MFSIDGKSQSEIEDYILRLESNIEDLNNQIEVLNKIIENLKRR